MNVLFFEQPNEDEESNEFEMLEQQSIEINALSADEVRALIAALEGKTSEASEEVNPTGGEEVSEDRKVMGGSSGRTNGFHRVCWNRICWSCPGCRWGTTCTRIVGKKDTSWAWTVPEPEKVVEAPQEPEPIQEITEVTKPETSEELQQKPKRNEKTFAEIGAAEVEEIEVLSESEEIGPEPETLIGEEEPPQIVEELEGQQSCFPNHLKIYWMKTLIQWS